MTVNRPSKGNEVIIYTRVSSPKQTFNTSLSGQETECRKYCEDMGYNLLHVFPEDKGKSGRNANRPSFQEALKYCTDPRNKKVGHFVVFKFSRFFRNCKYHMITYDDLLEKHGVRVESASEDFNTDSPMDKKMRANLAATAEFESDQISENASKGMMRVRAEGKLTNNPPLGLIRKWTCKGQTKVVHDPLRAGFFRKMFILFDEGKTTREIVDTINSLGFRTPKGHKLRVAQLHRVLRNINYAGYVVVNDETEPVKGDFEAIIDLELFYRVQAKLKGVNRKVPSLYKRDRTEFPLKRFLICAKCGKPLTASWSTSKSGKKHPYYSCTSKECPGSFRQELVHDDFIRIVGQYGISSGLMDILKTQLIDYYRGMYDRKEASLSSLEAEDTRIAARKQKLTDCFLDGKITQDLFDEQIDRINGQSEAISRKMIALRSELQTRGSKLDRYLCLFSNLALLWSQAPLELTQEIQKAFFPGVLWDIEGRRILLKEISGGLERLSD